MDIILSPILEKLKKLTNGVRLSQGSMLSCKLVMAVFDLPAKSMATNTKQFNGEHGCLYCLDKGTTFSRARIYPPDDQHVLRTTEQMKSWAKEAQATGKPVYGVKGECILAQYIDLPQCICIPIEYMHSILEGVFKQLTKYWFDPKFHSQPFSLRKHIPQINRIIAKIKPVDEIHRVPRPLDQLSFYKASEYRAWLLFYSLPILSHYLPPEYIHHLSLLVTAVHILFTFVKQNCHSRT